MIKQYQDHINKLTKEHNIKVDIIPSTPLYGMMFVEEDPPRIECPKIKTQIDYLITLHEIGHCIHGHTQARPPHTDKTFYFDNGVLKSEAQAWEYALDNCVDVIEDKSRYFMWDTCLGSYYLIGYLEAKGKPSRLFNGNRHHHEFIYDHPDTYFETIMKRIQGDITDFKIEYIGKY